MKILKEEKFDLIHAHWLIPQGFAAVQQAGSHGIPVVLTAHAGDVFGLNRFPFNLFMRKTLKEAAVCTVNSNATAKAVLKIYPKSKIEMIRMGVDLADFTPAKHSPELLSKYQKNKGKIIFAAGRLAEKKGFEYLIRALPAIKESEPDVMLLIAGFGPLEQNLKNLADRLHLKDSVLFVGNLNKREMAAFLATADIVTVPSIVTSKGDTEGQGVIVIEAFASGTPVVASAVGGITDLIEDGVNGSLVREKYPHDLAEKLLRLLKDEDQAAKLSQNALIAVKQFSWNEIAEKFNALYKNLLA